MLDKFENLKDAHLEQKDMNEEISNFFSDFVKEEDVEDDLNELINELENENAQNELPSIKSNPVQANTNPRVVVKA